MGGRPGQSPFDALSRETFEYPIALIRSAPRSMCPDEASQCPLWPIYATGVGGQRVTALGRSESARSGRRLGFPVVWTPTLRKRGSTRSICQKGQEG
jgi:hypothetical protein